MTFLGVFRDDFYNSISVLPQAQYKTTAQATGTVLAAANMSGAGDCYVNFTGQAATAITTDTAVNIIAALQSAVAAAVVASGAGFAAGVNAPLGVPNLFNVTYTLTIINNNSGILTLTGGTGVTVTGTNTLAAAVERQYTVTINSPTTITLQHLFGGAVI